MSTTESSLCKPLDSHVRKYYIRFWLLACGNDPEATRLHRDNLNNFKIGDAVY